MPTRTLQAPLRPGIRATVLLVSSALVLLMAVGVSNNVSDHLRQAAVDEATRSTTSVVLGYMRTAHLRQALLTPSPETDREINDRLAELVASGSILRIKIWQADGIVRFSDLPELRGRRFDVEPDLAEALGGERVAEFGDGAAAENEFERGLADRFLSIYLPIVAPDGRVLGAYEMYEDAAPIEAQVTTTRRDVVLFTAATALALLAMLYLAFAGTSRLLASQNRRLREQAVTEQLLAADLRRSEERFRALVRNSVDVSLIVGADGRIVYESPSVERVLGYRAEDRVGSGALDIVHQDDRPRLEWLFLMISRRADAEATAELRARHADGTWRWVEVAVKNRFHDPAVTGIIANYRDVTARRALEDELRLRAFHDALTGLANRGLFMDRLEHALARSRRGHQRPAVLFLDLDDFKTINDSLGHGEGDQLLIATAERLRGALRAGDTLARLGGDEFAVLVEDGPATGRPVEVAERLLEALQEPFKRSGRELFVHASVGVAVAGGRRGSAEELLRDADAAMYMAKGRGKNRVIVFEPGMHRAAVTRLGLKGDLERALDRGEFELRYQPIVDLRTASLSGVEALIRWRHPSRRLVLPGEFISLAEETGLIVPIGRWVLDEACRQGARWRLEAPELATWTSVNVSGRQVAESRFVDDVAAAIDGSGLPADRLVLEFTENVLIDDSAQSATTLATLKELGVRLAIDDFGTGFSSLSYLRRFPIDVLKIDGSFVATLGGGREQRAVVDAILRLSDTLRLETVAEGIEHAGQVAELRALGAVMGQGHYFAPPLTAGEISALLAAERTSTATPPPTPLPAVRSVA